MDQYFSILNLPLMGAHLRKSISVKKISLKHIEPKLFKIMFVIKPLLM